MPDGNIFTRQNAGMIRGEPPRSIWKVNQPARESRVLRERMIDHSAAIDLAQSHSPTSGTARQVVQIINGGSMPSSVPAYFLANPVSVSGDETEGLAPTFTADTSTSMVVCVLNKVPAVSDYLNVYLVGDRWVSDGGGGGGGDTCGCGCMPCVLPNMPLHISGTSQGVGFAVTLGNIAGACTWNVAGCLTIAGFGTASQKQFTFDIQCVGGVTTYRYASYTCGADIFCQSSCQTNLSVYKTDGSETSLTLNSFDCSPLNLSFTASNDDTITVTE